MPDVAALRERNNDREKQLALEGVFISPMVQLAAQIEVLVRKLASQEWEDERAEMLDIAESEIMRAKLTAGLGQGSQMSLADIG